MIFHPAHGNTASLNIFPYRSQRWSKPSPIIFNWILSVGEHIGKNRCKVVMVRIAEVINVSARCDFSYRRAMKCIVVLSKRKAMKKNMGYTDRIIRVIMAVIFTTLYFSGSVTGTPGIVLIALSAVFLGTSIIGSCPLYIPLGISTLRKKTTSKQ